MKKTNKIVILDAYKPEITKTDSEQKITVTKRKVRSNLRFAGKGVCFFGAVVLVFYLLGLLPVFQVQSIEVEGISSLSEEKAITLSGIQKGENIFFVNTWAAKKSLRQNPFVQAVKVKRHLPNKILLQITERKSIGYIVTTDGYVQVGENGRFLGIQQQLSNYSLPVISGVDLSELPAIGGFIENEKLKQALNILQNCDQSLLDNIAELNVGQEYYILAYTNQQLEVRLGGLDNIEQRLQDLNEILTDVVGTRIPVDQILYIDMRYNGSPIIKMR